MEPKSPSKNSVCGLRSNSSLNFSSPSPPPNSKRVNFVVLLNRREEGVYAFGAGDLEVDVEVQPGRDLGNILAVVFVVGDRRPPVAVDGEARQQRIQLTQEGAALVVCAGGVLLAAELERRARRLDRALRAVDVDLLLGIVFRFVLRIGSEKVLLAVRLLRLRCRWRSVGGLSAVVLFGVTRLRTAASALVFDRDSTARDGAGPHLGQPASLRASLLLWPAAGSAVVPDITR